MFYKIVPRGDGLVDVLLTPGEPVPFLGLDGRVHIRIRRMVVRGIDPRDPQWGGDLETHVREHYAAWLEAAEEVEA